MAKSARARVRGGLVVAPGALLATLVMGLAPAPAAAQTWVGGRTTPRLTEVVAIDATGEEGWLYGAEDVAGDGLETFQQQEQSIDIRTAYATADAQRLWTRVYASEQNAVGGNVTVFVFVDADRSAATGGTAEAPEIHAQFTSDASPGGYEHVIELRGNGAVTQIWTWSEPMAQYEAAVPMATEAAAEAGQDMDPILIGAVEHGYLQAMVDLAVLDLTAACDANLYFRSVNETASLGAGDLEVGEVAPCVPADGDGDGIPDVVVPADGCTADDQCPLDGICEGGTCVIAVPCAVDADCRAGEQCTSDGRCVPIPTGSCSASDECGDLVCTGGQCGACTLGGDECGAGRRCSPTGHCIDSVGPTGGGPTSGDGPGPGEAVRGGACACAVAGASAPRGLAALLASAGLALALRRRPKRAGARGRSRPRR